MYKRQPDHRSRTVAEAVLALEAARLALDAGKPEEALGVLAREEKPLRGVPRAAALVREAGRRVAEARSANLALARSSVAPGRSENVHLAEELAEEVRRLFRLEVSLEPAPADELRDVKPDVTGLTSDPILTEDGDQLVLAEAFGRWLFVRIVDIPGGHV